MPKVMKWRRDGTSATVRPIDMHLDGGPRLQVSSGVLAKEGYDNRRAAIREDWGKGGVWRLAIRALHAKRFTVGEWYGVRSQGVEALEAFLVASGAEPLRDLIRDYVKQSSAGDKGKMRQRLNRLASYLGKQASVADLTAAKIDAFLAQLIDERTAKTTKSPAQGSTVNRYRAVISGLATWAVKRGRLSAHPIAGKQVEKREEPPHRIPELSPDEYRDYLAKVRSERADLAVLVLVLIHTGADVGELWNLMARDVGLETKRIRLERPKTKRHKSANAPRFVPLPSVVVEELRGHIAEHQVKGSDRLFAMLSRRDLEWTHERAAASIARPELTLKDLRHVAAISWVKAGIHIRVVSRYLGHASLSQTMKYTDFEPDADTASELAERALDTLNKTAGVTPIRATG